MHLIPDHGNPLNQLAVIDTYEGNELDAVCLYFRSLVVKFPFPTAMDNLLILFQKAKKLNNEKNSTKSLIYSFISLHGLVFGPDCNMTLFESSCTNVVELIHQTLSSREFDNDTSMLEKFFKIAICAIFIYRKSVSSIDQVISLGKFMHDLICLIINHVNFNLNSQLQLTSNSINNQNHFEPFLVVIKLIFLILGSPTMRELESVYNTSPTMSLTATFINNISKFRKKFYPSYSSTSRNIALKEDEDLTGFLPLPSPLFQNSHPENIADDHLQTSIRLNQIQELSNQFCEFEVIF